jgi:predicted dehydrogenase
MTMDLAERDFRGDCPPNRFVDLILGKADANNYSGDVGSRSVELLDAAYRSAASGREESVA